MGIDLPLPKVHSQFYVELDVEKQLHASMPETIRVCHKRRPYQIDPPYLHYLTLSSFSCKRNKTYKNLKKFGRRI